jgi:hypothetical protein
MMTACPAPDDVIAAPGPPDPAPDQGRDLSSAAMTGANLLRKFRFGAFAS